MKAALSFLYNGEELGKLPVTVSESEDTIVYRMPDGIEITSKIERFPAYGGVRWTNFWSNPTDHPSGLISALFDCDVTVPFYDDTNTKANPSLSLATALADEKLKVFVPKGSVNDDDDYYAEPKKLNVGAHFETHNVNGRSADGVMPFFELNQGKHGVIYAVGWTGAWTMQLDRTKDDVRIRTGLPEASFRMLPGETFRTGSVTMLEYFDGTENAHNVWRRFMKNEISPIGRYHGARGEQLPFSAIFWGGIPSDRLTARWEKIFENRLPFEYCWIDAGWYEPLRSMTTAGQLREWPAIGTWEVNRFYHPDEYRDVTAYLHEHDVKMLVWLEPERIDADVRAWTKYLSLPDDPKRGVIALQEESVYQDTLALLSRSIEKLSLGCYRQDFNIAPLPYWRAADAAQENGAERKGTTEIHYINNLYRLWDALLEKYPHLLIDNCSSGGRRNDIEMLSRAVPLWRSDYQCQWDCSPETNQIQSAAFAWWYPYSGVGYGPTLGDTYSFRSAYTNGLTVRPWEHIDPEWEVGARNEPMDWARTYFGEFQELRHYFAEDFYLLIPLSRENTAWTAEQYHDPADNSGILLAFRRPESPYDNVRLCMNGLEPDAEYVFENRDTKETFVCSGKELLTEGIRLTIADRRESLLLSYRKK